MKLKIKMLFILLAIIVIAIIFSPKSMAATNVNLSASNRTPKPGDTVTITVSVSSSTPIVIVNANVNFNTDIFEYVSSSSSYTYNRNGNNVNFLFDTTDDNRKSSITLGTIRLKVKNNATDGAKSTVSVTSATCLETLMSEEKSATRGSVTITATVPKEEPKSSDNTLKSLKVSPSGLSPAFSKNVTSYKMTVDSDVTRLSVNAVPTDSNATVRVAGYASLKEGTNIVNITVTAENGSKKTYKITVTKKVDDNNTTPIIPNVIDKENEQEINNENEENDNENSNEEEKKVELNLQNLAIVGTEITPKFNPNIYEYTAQVEFNVNNLEVSAIPTVEDAVIEITGNENLKVGENIITLLVTSADGKETKTYQIIVTKAEQVVEQQTEQTDLENYNKIAEDAARRNALQRYILMGTIAIITVLIIVYLVGVYKKGKNSNMSDAIDYTEEKISENAKQDKGKRFK